jgi:hypothetical protein
MRSVVPLRFLQVLLSFTYPVGQEVLAVAGIVVVRVHCEPFKT